MDVETPLSPERLHATDGYWRAANYLSVGRLYLYDGVRPVIRRCPVGAA